jgi:hypothetical protein
MLKYGLYIPSALAALSLAACGGGGGGGGGGSSSGGDTTTPTNTSPLISAGSDISATELDELNLDGSASDSDGDTLTISWEQVSGDYDVSLNDDSILDPAVTLPPVPEDYEVVLRLTVSDGVSAAVTDDVTITVADQPSEMTIDPGTIGTAGQMLSLTARAQPAELDPDGGDAVTGSWELTSGQSVAFSTFANDGENGLIARTVMIDSAPAITSSQTYVVEFTAEDWTGSTASVISWAENWVAADSSSDRTVLGDFS